MADKEAEKPKEERATPDPEAVIQRLISEQNQTRDLLDKVRQELSSDSEFDGLTLVGGIKSLIRRYREEKEKVEKLNKELDQMLKSKITERTNRT